MDEQAIRLRRYNIYRKLYTVLAQEAENDPNVEIADMLQATCMLLVNENRIVERTIPHYHVTLLDHLIRLFDDPELLLNDENEPH